MKETTTSVHLYTMLQNTGTSSEFSMTYFIIFVMTAYLNYTEQFKPCVKLEQITCSLILREIFQKI